MPPIKYPSLGGRPLGEGLTVLCHVDKIASFKNRTPRERGAISFVKIISVNILIEKIKNKKN